MKILYDLIGQKLQPYPRDDDGDVVGLDPSYLVLDVIQQEQPTVSLGQVLRATESIDLDARQVVRGWTIETMPPQWINAQAFMAAFTDQEKAAIALSADPAIAGMRLTLSTWLSAMHPDDPRVSGGLARLVTLGIINEQRKAEIIATAA